MAPRKTIPAVSVAVVRGKTVLLVKRARAPSQGLYAYPGGKVEAGETLAQAVARELEEETGLEARDYRPLRDIRIDGCGENLFVGNSEMSHSRPDHPFASRRNRPNVGSLLL